jgi:hypothetical protein
MVCAAAAMLAAAAPAKAQMFAPFGGPGMLTAPEAASGAIGAGAAHSAAQQQQCIQSVVGRGGVQTVCPSYSAPPPPHR